MNSDDEARPDGLKGSRVLVVEDEVAIALLVEDMLGDLGCDVAGPAGRVAAALREIESAPPDLAILDVNVAGEPVYPVAEALARRGIPFVFSTGYGSGGIDESFRDRPVVQKPFSQDELERQLRAALSR